MDQCYFEPLSSCTWRDALRDQEEPRCIKSPTMVMPADLSAHQPCSEEHLPCFRQALCCLHASFQREGPRCRQLRALTLKEFCSQGLLPQICSADACAAPLICHRRILIICDASDVRASTVVQVWDSHNVACQILRLVYLLPGVAAQGHCCLLKDATCRAHLRFSATLAKFCH